MKEGSSQSSSSQRGKGASQGGGSSQGSEDPLSLSSGPPRKKRSRVKSSRYPEEDYILEAEVVVGAVGGRGKDPKNVQDAGAGPQGKGPVPEETCILCVGPLSCGQEVRANPSIWVEEGDAKGRHPLKDEETTVRAFQFLATTILGLPVSKEKISAELKPQKDGEGGVALPLHMFVCGKDIAKIERAKKVAGIMKLCEKELKNIIEDLRGTIERGVGEETGNGKLENVVKVNKDSGKSKGDSSLPLKTPSESTDDRHVRNKKDDAAVHVILDSAAKEDSFPNSPFSGNIRLAFSSTPINPSASWTRINCSAPKRNNGVSTTSFFSEDPYDSFDELMNDLELDMN